MTGSHCGCSSLVIRPYVTTLRILSMDVFRLDFPGDLYADNGVCCAWQKPIASNRGLNMSHESGPINTKRQRWVDIVNGTAKTARCGIFINGNFLHRSKNLCATETCEVQVTPPPNEDDDADKCLANRWVMIIDGMLSHSVIFTQQQMSTQHFPPIRNTST